MARRVLFSDIDGTLVHYNKDFDAKFSGEGDGRVLSTSAEGAETVALPLPVSSTGKRGWISAGTIDAVARVRASGVPFVLVSGARTSTVLGRLPHLPTADAVVTENGGRVFYPPPPPASAAATPSAAGVEQQEDLAWRERHIGAAGAASQGGLDASQREGLLWDVCRQFVAAGFKVDTVSYETCFRVTPGGESPEALQAALRALPPALTSTFNLGMADVYPTTSGKAAAAAYLAERFGCALRDCAFMCDDDNDIELALACGRAYLPTVSSDTMQQAVSSNPGHYFVATDGTLFGTEQALRQLMADWHIAPAAVSQPEAAPALA